MSYSSEIKQAIQVLRTTSGPQKPEQWHHVKATNAAHSVALYLNLDQANTVDLNYRVTGSAYTYAAVST